MTGHEAPKGGAGGASEKVLEKEDYFNKTMFACTNKQANNTVAMCTFPANHKRQNKRSD